MMYLSGRALHPVTVNLAAMLDADSTVRCCSRSPAVPTASTGPTCWPPGWQTVTVCSDLLKIGRVSAAAAVRRAARGGDGRGRCGGPARPRRRRGRRRRLRPLRRPAPLRRPDAGGTGATRRRRCGPTTRRRTGRSGSSTASRRPASTSARSTRRCPQYMEAVRTRRLAVAAARLTRQDNPLPAILGRVCDHHCEDTCIRTHLDQPLAIRHIKRFIMEQETPAGPACTRSPPTDRGWPSSVPARRAYRPRRSSPSRASRSTILEAHPYPGGMVGGAIPAYRLPQASIDQDVSPSSSALA